MSAVWADLAAALAQAPELPDARCRGEHDLFDGCDFERGETRAQAADRHEIAVAICRSCPELEPCRDWSMQFGYPLDHVIGGRVPAKHRPTDHTHEREAS